MNKPFAAAIAACIVAGIAASAQAQGPEQQRFHAIYKELVETNTTHSAGDNTLAAQRMAKHLREAGFAESDLQILEPFPKKGNLVLRFKGDGSKKPLLLLAHLDVVEALRADWQSDPFVLREADGYFTARGSIDDKAMAAALRLRRRAAQARGLPAEARHHPRAHRRRGARRRALQRRATGWSTTGAS